LIIDNSWLIGRNIEVQQLVEMLTEEGTQRFILLEGSQGCGKKMIAKKAVKYCLDRNFFKDGVYEVGCKDN
jgi:MoxR-like ATPase